MAKRRANSNPNFEETGVNRFFLRKISPLTETQKEVFDSYAEGYNLMLHGYAGTGKSFISLYLALKDVLTDNIPYDKVVIIRSVVQSRDMGFLPGTEKEKMKVFEEPYREIFAQIFNRKDAYDMLRLKNKVEFTTTSFLRGLTFEKSIIIVDEAQNMNFQELDTVITRVGTDSKIIFCGDFRQTDLNKKNDMSGIKQFMDITDRINSFVNIEFEIDDIVRSGLVKEYIIQKTERGI